MYRVQQGLLLSKAFQVMEAGGLDRGGMCTTRPLDGLLEPFTGLTLDAGSMIDEHQAVAADEASLETLLGESLAPPTCNWWMCAFIVHAAQPTFLGVGDKTPGSGMPG